MQKSENILIGIALILFGIASMLIFNYTEWGVFEVFGVISPIAGLIVVIVGAIYEGKTNDPKN